ncbi:hypothetical protein ACTFIW_012053 [Dictyostelium discoideum]
MPKTALFTVNNTAILAERRIPFQQNNYEQKKIYEQLSDEDQNIQMTQQLALFIIETGFSNVEHRNIDLEEVSSPITGLFGIQSFPPRTGLIRCIFSVQQISTVYENLVLPPAPPKIRKGKPHTPGRKICNSLFWILITVSRWRNLPRCVIWDSRSVTHRWLRIWQENGTL